jgi:DnaJ-domain-containing protein 1
VDGFIDRLYELWKSLFGNEGGKERPGASEGGDRGRAGSARTRPAGDPDFQEAWEELDEYMRTGSNRARSNRAAGSQERTRSRTPRPVDESLRQDYANLEVPFGADIDEVRRSYKRLMLKYHPDKHAGDTEKQKLALEITKKINESFERIRSRQESAG